MKISKELLSEVLGEDVRLGVYTTVESDEDELVQHIMKIEIYGNRVSYWRYYKEWDDGSTMCRCSINIYELVYLKLKQWSKLKNVFGKVDWSEEPEEILKKAEELRNQINEKQLQH